MNRNIKNAVYYLLLIITIIGCTVHRFGENKIYVPPVVFSKPNPDPPSNPIINFVRAPRNDTVINDRETVEVISIDTIALNFWFAGIEEKIKGYHVYDDLERRQLKELVNEYKKVIVENGVLLAHFVEAKSEKQKTEIKMETTYDVFQTVPLIIFILYLMWHAWNATVIRDLKKERRVLEEEIRSIKDRKECNQQ